MLHICKGEGNLTKVTKKGIREILFAAILGALGGFVNGFLGAGGGIILLYALSRMNKSRGPGAVRDNFGAVVCVVLLLSTVSAVTYSHNSDLELSYLLTLALPGMAGGVAGAFLTDKLNTDILKACFCVILIIAGINMAF